MEYEKYQRYIERIRQIDETLCPSVKSLIELANREGPAGDPLRENRGEQSGQSPVFFPPWVAEYKWPRTTGHYLLTRAACCSTLKRIEQIRRRFPNLKGTLKSSPEELIENTFVPTEPHNPVKCASRLQSQTFGLLNPFTASQVLSVLMDAGERRAHSGIGFLAFFAMTWSLFRCFPAGVGRGAYLGPGNPTAYVTAKCLLPIQRLDSVCRKRADLFSDIKDALERLDGLSKKTANQYSSWEFTATVDELSNLILRTSKLAINPSALQGCAEEIKDSAGEHGPQIDAQESLNKVRGFLVSALREVVKNIKEVADEARPVVDWIEERIVEKLKSQRQWDGKLTDELSLELGQEWLGEEKYWNDLREAAKTAHEICAEALQMLRNSSESCEAALADQTVPGISNALTLLANANESLADLFDDKFRNHARWCRTVVDREIAHISAKNYTDFDPAELVSGIAAAVRWGEMNSSLEVRDAVGKALEGARKDGSWRPGQPFYTVARGLAVVPVTSDNVWTLATAVTQHPEITGADRIFEQYVEWLERTQTEVKAVVPPIDLKPKPVPIIGWPSERAREPRSVDLWATALAINALLEIRGLFEYRLWQICKDRFTVPQPRKRFHELDPVDLGAKHVKRIQRQLMEFSRHAQVGDKDAEYALVLHGPPGSSKTSLAEALATEIWSRSTGESRLIRITPADFTRRGEQRLDYEARVIFELLQSVRGVTILFDEIDDFLRRRQPGVEPTFIKLVVPAMLNRLQDLRDVCPRQELCILFATNFIEQIEPALLRRGRIDQCIPVVYPDPDSRHAIVCRHIDMVDQDDSAAKILADHRDLVVTGTSGWPWKTVDELCRRVADRAKRGEFNVDDPATKGKIEVLISEFKARLTDPSYQKRLNDSGARSSELRLEVLQYCLAYASRPDGYIRELKTLKGDLAQDGLRVWDASGRQAESHGRALGGRLPPRPAGQHHRTQ